MDRIDRLPDHRDLCGRVHPVQRRHPRARIAGKLVCYLCCLGLPVLDVLIISGAIGPGWPRPARTSVELLGFALSVFLLNEAIYQAITPRLFSNARAIVLSRIRWCLYGIALIALLESWLSGPGNEQLRKISTRDARSRTGCSFPG
jgi:hypothetical protein